MFRSRASTFAAKKGKDVVCLREKKVIVVICAGKSNIRRVDDICTWTEMWKQMQTISSLDSRQNLNEQKNHDGGKGKGVRAKGQTGKRTRGQKGKRAKTTNYKFPHSQFLRCFRAAQTPQNSGPGLVDRSLLLSRSPLRHCCHSRLMMAQSQSTFEVKWWYLWFENCFLGVSIGALATHPCIYQSTFSWILWHEQAWEYRSSIFSKAQISSVFTVSKSFEYRILNIEYRRYFLRKKLTKFLLIITSRTGRPHESDKCLPKSLRTRPAHC